MLMRAPDGYEVVKNHPGVVIWENLNPKKGEPKYVYAEPEHFRSDSWRVYVQSDSALGPEESYAEKLRGETDEEARSKAIAQMEFATVDYARGGEFNKPEKKEGSGNFMF